MLSPRSLAVLVCLLLAASAGAHAADAVALRADPALARRVTLRAAGISLDDLLGRLAFPGVRMTCARSCAACKVQVCLTGRPLHEVMAALAELLPGAWERLEADRGYRLAMDSAAVRYRERWWSLLLADRARALEAQRHHVLETMRAPSPQPGSVSPDAEASDPIAEAAAEANRAWFRSLPGPLQERVAARLAGNALYGASALYSGNPYPREGAVCVPVEELGAAAREALARESPALAAPGTLVRLCNMGFAVSAAAMLPDGRFTGLPFGLTVDLAPEAATVALNERFLAVALQQLGDAAPRAWRELAAYAARPVWPNDAPAEIVRRFPPSRRADAQTRIATSYGVDIVSDFHSTPGDPLQRDEWERRPERPLKAKLDRCAAQHDTSWKRTAGGIVLLRNNRWYRDDLLEVPATVIERLAARRPAPRTPAELGSRARQARYVLRCLDWQAEVASSLTPWQIANGLSYYVAEPADGVRFDAEKPARAWRPYARAADDILASYNALLLYAGLSARERLALIEGTLSFGALSPARQRAAAIAAPELEALRASQGTGPILLAAELEAPAGGVLVGYNPAPRGEPSMQLALRAVVAGRYEP